MIGKLTKLSYKFCQRRFLLKTLTKNENVYGVTNKNTASLCKAIRVLSLPGWGYIIVASGPAGRGYIFLSCCKKFLVKRKRN